MYSPKDSGREGSISNCNSNRKTPCTTKRPPRAAVARLIMNRCSHNEIMPPTVPAAIAAGSIHCSEGNASEKCHVSKAQTPPPSVIIPKRYTQCVIKAPSRPPPSRPIPMKSRLPCVTTLARSMATIPNRTKPDISIRKCVVRYPKKQHKTPLAIRPIRTNTGCWAASISMCGCSVSFMTDTRIA